MKKIIKFLLAGVALYLFLFWLIRISPYPPSVKVPLNGKQNITVEKELNRGFSFKHIVYWASKIFNKDKQETYVIYFDTNPGETDDIYEQIKIYKEDNYYYFIKHVDWLFSVDNLIINIIIYEKLNDLKKIVYKKSIS
jgi:hypothetical protein